MPTTVRPEGNNHGINGVSSKQKYNVKLAVSVVARVPHSCTDTNIRDCLNHRLRKDLAYQNPVVLCKKIDNKNESGTEYYVELRTPGARDGLLNLNNARIDYCGDSIWPKIEPWELPSSSSQSHTSDRCSNSHSWKQREQQHRHQNNTNKNDWGNTNENSEREIYGRDEDNRPSKRPKKDSTTMSPSENHKKKNSALSTDVIGHEPNSKNLHAPTLATRDPSSRKEGDIISTTSPIGNTTISNCKLFLTKNPDQYTPESFQDYLNQHLKETKIGVSDDAYVKPPILNCYENPTPNIHDGWVLETKTGKIAEKIIDHVSGKLVLSGTRLYFQRHGDLSRGGGVVSSPPPPLQSPSAEDTNGKNQWLSSSSPSLIHSWRDETCMVFVSTFPYTIPRQEVISFINTFMQKSLLFDRDVIIDSRCTRTQHRTSSFLCISAEAAQRIVDELDDVTLKKSRLKIRRHFKTYKQQQQRHPAYDRTYHENQNGGIAPRNRVRQLRIDTESNRSVSLSSISTSQMYLAPSTRNQIARNTDSTIMSRFVFLSFHENYIIHLSKVMLFLDSAIIDRSCDKRSYIVGAERKSSSCYLLETNTVEAASKLVKLSGVMYDDTVVLTLRKSEGDRPKNSFSAMADRPTIIDRGAQGDNPTNATTTAGVSDSANASNPATNKDIAHLKDKNENLTKQVMKLLKENKDLKKQNEILASATFPGSGSHEEPIELEGSGDEENKIIRSPQKHEEENFDEIKKKYKSVASELEKFKADKKQLEKELFTAKDTCNELRSQGEEPKKEAIDDYERRLHEIHESWREQNVQIHEQVEAIASLKVGLEQETAEKERLNLQLQDAKRRYQDMTDALTRSTVMVQEEMAVRKSMTLSLVKERKAKKRAERKLKLQSSPCANVKAEDKYDV